MPKNATLSSPVLFPHPFSKAYWVQACSEFKKTKVLVFAALMIALRVALKSLGIPIGMDLKINIAFFINAFGAMVFGPVVAAVAAAISDTLGCLLFPTGAYFFPFIFIEIAGSVIFALFLYRAKVTTSRVIWSRFCIDFFVNIVLNTPIMWCYYHFVMGKYYAIFDLPRIVKNLAMFPIEALLLVIFFRLILPQAKRLKLVYSDAEKLHFTKKNILTMVILLVVGTISVCGYSVYKYNTTSLSASYTAQERYERNEAMNAIVMENNPELAESSVLVTIVESAIPKFGDPNVTYSVAVYALNPEEMEANVPEMQEKYPNYGEETIRGYSKSKAKADDALTSLGTATIVINKDTNAVVSYEDTIE